MIPRRMQLDRLDRQTFDLLIIGGGIVGAGIARDAAMRGLSVVMAEQGDFASGASSKTSKLIHGGLRYLEQGRLRLVAQSLREREILRAIAPDAVKPLSLLLPVYRHGTRPAWKIRAGLLFYDLLSGSKSVQRSGFLSAPKALAAEAALRAEGLSGAGSYGDCQMDDARLCLLNILQAQSFGAACLNYVRVRALLKAQARVCGAAIEDVWTKQAFEVRARVVINACGPWADQVRRLSDPAAQTRLSPTKGIHLIVPRLSLRGLFIESRRDRRMLFILPWGENSLIGTTESAVDGPLESLHAQADEVGYLLEEVKQALPQAAVTEKDIIATFAGARPLLAYSGSVGHASREHAIEVDRFGMISVLGGKYTTYRRMAADAVDCAVNG
jgi:glycerol-3-phosphate dehydrogenase